jgi:hypothetical protein
MKGDQGVLWYQGRICVPNIKELEDKILQVAHEFAYSIHPRENKMYYDLKATYWLYGMKRDVAKYIALCDTYSRAKTVQQQPIGLLQPLQVPEWKWEEIAMDFVVALTRAQSEYDSLWAIVGRLAMVAHLVPIQMTYTRPQLVELYVSRIVCLHGVS